MLRKTLTAASAAALLAATGLAGGDQVQAQENQVNEEEVRSFLGEVRDELTELVRAGELERLREKVQARVADEAQFAMGVQMMKDDEHKTFNAATLEKDDILAVMQVITAPDGIAIDDYELEVEVEVAEVVPHGTGAATVRSRWTDSGTIAHAEQGQAAAGNPEISFERELRCTHILHRDDGQQFMFGLTACDGQVRL
jgi:hypothetical protein